MDAFNASGAAELFEDFCTETQQADLLMSWHGILHEDVSTASSSLQKVSDSNELDKHDRLRPQSTPQTSQSSHPRNTAVSKKAESDLEAQHGSSDDAHPESLSESSSSSDGSLADLPSLSAYDKMKNIGHHLPNPTQHSPPAGLQPKTDDEARVVIDRENRARGQYIVPH